MVFMSGRTETHSLGRTDRPVVHNSRMVMQPAADVAVGGSRPNRAQMSVLIDRRGFEPPTEKISSQLRYHSTVGRFHRNAHPHCLEPSDYKLLYHTLGYAKRTTPKKWGIRRPRLRLI